MSSTSSVAALLHVALEDLHAGKEAQAARLPAIARRCSDARLRSVIEAEGTQALVHAGRISAAVSVAGPENLWMNGILDDAERDIRQTQPGRLLDVALIGAIRKAKAAEIVSSETAVALARHLQDLQLTDIAAANRFDEVNTDRALKAILIAITGADFKRPQEDRS